MRDRYKSLKELTEVSPDWANGCDQCKAGIVSSPALTGACELYLERLVQAIDGDIHFCDCKAGIRYRVFLKNRLLFLRAEAKQHKQMGGYAERGSHPDIENARKAIQSSAAYVKAPTVRWVDAAQPAEEKVMA